MHVVMNLPADPVSVPPGAAGRIAASGGRATRTRTAVLDVLLAAAQPLSHEEVAQRLHAMGEVHDRVTLYRALDWLAAQSLISRVAGNDRAARFEAQGDDRHAHAHFHCRRCGAMRCLDSLQPAVAAALPPGFQLERAELVLHGVCDRCSALSTNDGSLPGEF